MESESFSFASDDYVKFQGFPYDLYHGEDKKKDSYSYSNITRDPIITTFTSPAGSVTLVCFVICIYPHILYGGLAAELYID